MKLFKSQEEKQLIAEARSDFDDFVKAATSAEPEQARGRRPLVDRVRRPLSVCRSTVGGHRS